MGSKSRQNSNMPNRLSVSDRTELLTKIGTRDGEVILQEDISLSYVWNSSLTGANNGGTIIEVGTGSWVHKVVDKINIVWFGADNTGTVSSNSALQSALLVGGDIEATYGTYLFDGTTNYNIANNIVDFNNSIINCTMTVTNSIFGINEKGAIKNAEIVVSSATFVSVLQLLPTSGTRILERSNHNWAENIRIQGNWFGDGSVNGQTGSAILMHTYNSGSIEASIQLTRCSGISIKNMQYGIRIKTQDATWCNSNSFFNVLAYDCMYPIYEEHLSSQALAGNTYAEFTYQYSAGNFGLVLQDKATVGGIIWDGGGVEFKGSLNVLRIATTSLYTIIDNGKHNLIHAESYEYDNGTAVWKDDNRYRLEAFKGRTEIVDEFTGKYGMRSLWNETIVGAGQKRPTINSRGTVDNPVAELGVQIETGATIGDSYLMDFGGYKMTFSELNPTIFMTFRLTATTGHIGYIELFNNGSNYIRLNLNSGSDMSLETNFNGTSTITTLKRRDDNITTVQPSWSQFYFLTLDISATLVKALLGVQAYDGSNLYQGIYLQEKTSESYEAINTTNIPLLKPLEPSIYIETTSANVVNMVLLDFKLISQNGF